MVAAAPPAEAAVAAARVPADYVKIQYVKIRREAYTKAPRRYAIPPNMPYLPLFHGENVAYFAVGNLHGVIPYLEQILRLGIH